MSSPSAKQKSDVLARTCTYLGAASGADKVYRLINYSIALAMPNIVGRYGADSEIVGKLRSISDHFNKGRTMLRLFGILDVIQGLRNLHLEKDPIQRRLSLCKAVTMLGFYPLDNLYYLSDIKVLKLDGNEISRLSCRLWLMYIIFDLIGDSLLLNKVEDKGDRKETQAEWRRLMLKFTVNLFDLVIAVHFSLKNSPLAGTALGSRVVGLSGVVSTIGYWRLRWRGLP